MKIVLRISLVCCTALFLAGCFKDPPAIPEPGLPDLQVDSLMILTSDIPPAEYTDLTFTNEQTGYAVSLSGEAVKTTDGGLHWQRMPLPLQANLHRIQFISAGTGYITGGADTLPSAFLLRTTDAGATWQRLDIGTPSPGSPAGMQFIDDSTGFVAGKNYLKKTLDGGRIWTTVPGTSAEDFTDVRFNGQKGYAVARSGKFFTTVNRGGSWQEGRLYSSGLPGELALSPGKTYVRVGNTELVDMETLLHGCTVPAGASRILFLSDTRSIGIGQHYENGFWPYGDIYLSSTLWQTSQSKRFEPGQAVNFRAVSRAGNHQVIMLGNGLLQATVVRLRY